jgi:hypothetical protein
MALATVRTRPLPSSSRWSRKLTVAGRGRFPRDLRLAGEGAEIVLRALSSVSCEGDELEAGGACTSPASAAISPASWCASGRVWPVAFITSTMAEFIMPPVQTTGGRSTRFLRRVCCSRSLGLRLIY